MGLLTVPDDSSGQPWLVGSRLWLGVSQALTPASGKSGADAGGLATWLHSCFSLCVRITTSGMTPIKIQVVGPQCTLLTQTIWKQGSETFLTVKNNAQAEKCLLDF